jgi:hypothetical protein
MGFGNEPQVIHYRLNGVGYVRHKAQKVGFMSAITHIVHFSLAFMFRERFK